MPWQLADETVILSPVYTGKVRIGKIASLSVVIATLGDEVIIGRALTNRFKLTLDHGRKLILEP